MLEHPNFPNLFVGNHPLVLHKLSAMRDVNCGKREFKANLREISLLMAYEITRHLELENKTITTPLCAMDAPSLKTAEPAIIPILRAGLGMSEGLEEIIPNAQVGHIGLYRDHDTHKPVEYLVKLPAYKGQSYIVVDPMLATGHSAKHAIDVIIARGVPESHILLLTLVGAPEGVREFHKHYPKIPVYMAALDDKLNENAYIVPGLGDAGDRLFGTL